MKARMLIGLAVMSMFGLPSWAADSPGGGSFSVDAASAISSVTVYSSSALVTRQVTTPATAGVVELVVGPLPPSIAPKSLYSEGSNGIRIMSTRYRTRVVQENTVAEAQKLETEIKELTRQEQNLQKQIQTNEQNAGLLGKLEGFTSGSLQQLTEKGMLNSDQITNLVKFIMDTRAARAKIGTDLQKELSDVQEKREYARRQLQKLSGTSDKTVREAVIVIDSEKAAAGKVSFNYIVSNASWTPQYKLRSVKDKPEVSLEYLAAIYQQSGEDWKGVDITLSTAQPMLNAAPPELSMLEVNVSAARNMAMANQPVNPGLSQSGQIAVNGGNINVGSSARVQNQFQAKQAREEAQSLSNFDNMIDANRRFNDAAAFLQSDEILNADDKQSRNVRSVYLEGQSVTFHIDHKLSIPWRDDAQMVEVARTNLKPDYFYKAVPVLTSHVYRLAKLTNDSKLIILPGEATVYMDTDFVGRTSLPLVAIGETFTAGFGVDPQLQITRQQIDKTKTIQGGNQVLKFDYRLTVSSYKTEPVKLQLWDRLPHGETEAVNVTLASTSKELSTDADYVQDDKPKNLLRWDLTVEPTSRGEKAMNVNYQYKMEFAKDANIGGFNTK